MTRLLTLITAVAFAGAVGIAQSHPQHPPRQHPPGHVPPSGQMDPALHALLHGSWHGQLSAAKGESTEMSLKVGTDKGGKHVFEMAGAKSLRIGAMTELTGEHHKLRWRQEISGKSCEATADVASARSESPDTLKGTIACGQDRFNFQLTKSTK